jgi:hypothetical protein
MQSMSSFKARLTPKVGPAGAAILLVLVVCASCGSGGADSTVSAGSPSASPSASASPTLGPAAFRFTAAGDMTVQRSGQTATLLPDGRVLIAGGDDEGSAEMYDPQTGEFSPTGSMAVDRADHSATLLKDGRVLIYGGNDNFVFSGDKLLGFYQDPLPASAEIYDPATGKFSATGSVPMVPDPATFIECPESGCGGLVAWRARSGHTATLLPDGRVLVAGGQVSCCGMGFATAEAELYDPVTGQFSPTGSMTEPRGGQLALLLADGRVLMVGGTDAMGDPVSSTEVYDPARGTFSRAGSLLSDFGVAGGAMLADGRVLILDGYDPALNYTPDKIPPASAEIYDPTSGVFTRTGPMVKATGGTAVLLADGWVLFVGIWAQPSEIYDPTSGTFSSVGHTLSWRGGFTATRLGDGRALVAGGTDNYLNRLQSVELFGT